MQAHKVVVISCVLFLNVLFSGEAFPCPKGYSSNDFGMCMPNVGGDVGKIGQGAINETRRLAENLAREIGKTPEAVQECFSDVRKCVNEIMSAPLALPIQIYVDGLYRQSVGKSYAFSPEFIELAQPHYSVDLRGITWANDIDTGHGMTVAMCDRIFFSGHGNPWSEKAELHHVLHELEHTVQCQGRGQRTYLAEYILKAGLDVVKTGRLNVHDVHDFEVAAERKANSISDGLWKRIITGTARLPAGMRPNSTQEGQSLGKFPSGNYLLACGCWGPNPPAFYPEPRCVSGTARPIFGCPGSCNPWNPAYAIACD